MVSSTACPGTATKLRAGWETGCGRGLEIADCLLIESVQDWRDKSSAHCVAGDKLPYRSTFGYVLTNPIRFAESIKYEQKGGRVTWACA